MASAAGGGGRAGGERDSPSQELERSVLVMSGGEGYIDFRMGEKQEPTAPPAALPQHECDSY